MDDFSSRKHNKYFPVNGKKLAQYLPNKTFLGGGHTHMKVYTASHWKYSKVGTIWSNLNATAIKAINVNINCNNEIKVEL